MYLFYSSCTTMVTDCLLLPPPFFKSVIHFLIKINLTNNTFTYHKFSIDIAITSLKTILLVMTIVQQKPGIVTALNSKIIPAARDNVRFPAWMTVLVLLWIVTKQCEQPKQITINLSTLTSIETNKNLYNHSKLAAKALLIAPEFSIFCAKLCITAALVL